jgi:hypothetical protein
LGRKQDFFPFKKTAFIPDEDSIRRKDTCARGERTSLRDEEGSIWDSSVAVPLIDEFAVLIEMDYARDAKIVGWIV